jgi:DNA-directed RNA polymerase subunit RPC12/RpoP
MFQYLKERQYYIDLYDLHTIEECLDWYWRLRKGMEQHRNELQKSDPDHDFDTEVHKGCSYVVNALKGERYRHKNERIDEWMAKDKKLQDLQDNTLPPENIRCEDCHSKTKLIETTLHESFADNTARVSFMFECLKCQKRAVYYEDGSKWEYEREKCKDCHVVLESKAESDKKNDTLTMTTFCPNCTYKVVHVTDFKRNDEERKRRMLEIRLFFKSIEPNSA